MLSIGVLALIAMPFIADVVTDSISLQADSKVVELEEAEVSDDVIQNLSAILAPVNEQIPVLTIRPSLMAGVYEVILKNEQVLYVSESGSYFVVGDMFTLIDGELANVSEGAKNVARSSFNQARQEELAKVDTNSYIIYPATNEELAVVTIFTDVDCPYCRKLHSEMKGYNDLGITVQYAAYPRAGVGSNAYVQMVSAWCSDEPNIAMDSLKRMKKIPMATCDNPVDMHMELGGSLGVTGTPAIFTENGGLIPGYVPPAELAVQLGLI